MAQTHLRRPGFHAHAGIANVSDFHPVFKVVVFLDSNNLFDFQAGCDVVDGLRYQSLGDTSATEAAIAGDRTNNNLDSEVTFDLKRNG